MRSIAQSPRRRHLFGGDETSPAEVEQFRNPMNDQYIAGLGLSVQNLFVVQILQGHTYIVSVVGNGSFRHNLPVVDKVLQRATLGIL